MEIRLRDTGQVMMESEFRSSHPNTSFPAQLSVEVLDEFGADAVLNGPQPTATRYQIVARDGVEQVDGKWFTKFVAVDMSDEAKAALDAQQTSSMRAERNRRLSDCDWTQLEDSPVDKAAWSAYRQQLRDIPTVEGFPWDIVWPEAPTS